MRRLPVKMRRLPVKMRRLPKSKMYRVYDGKRITAKRTTKRKAERQVKLLRGVSYGFEPGY